MAAPLVVKVRARPETGKLYLDFGYRGTRCREYTALQDTPANRRQVAALARRIERDIRSGRFEYAQYFPDSPRAREAARPQTGATPALAGRAVTPAVETPAFKDFSETWFKESEPRWRSRYRNAIREVLEKHLLAWFGEMPIGEITRGDILAFRAEFARRKGRHGDTISAKRISGSPAM